ncbi:MAG: M23 family metallopeptidase, partial [bacterium]
SMFSQNTQSTSTNKRSNSQPFALLGALVLLGCAPIEVDPRVPAQNSAAKTQREANRRPPAYSATLASDYLDPLDLFGLGLYNHREFGCCSPRHLGVDLLARAGTPVKALAPGVILPSPISGPHCQYGYVVVVWTKLDDGAEEVTVYGHLSGRSGERPKLSGTVGQGEILGYIGHSGGVSPAGERCGEDDENGDGTEHLHLGMRYGPPKVDANGNYVWTYYGYAGNGEDVDFDASGEAHGGWFTDPLAWALSHAPTADPGSYWGTGPGSSSSSSGSNSNPSPGSGAGSSSSSESSSAASQSSDRHDERYSLCGRTSFNLVVNGEFYLPASCGWVLEDHLGGARLEQLCSDYDNCHAAMSASMAGEIYNTQVYQLVPIRSGQRYRLTFQIQSPVLSGFQLQLMKWDAPWTNYGLNEWVLSDSVPREREFYFTASESDNYAKLAFQIGQNTTAYSLSHVYLKEMLP